MYYVDAVPHRQGMALARRFWAFSASLILGTPTRRWCVCVCERGAEGGEGEGKKFPRANPNTHRSVWRCLTGGGNASQMPVKRAVDHPSLWLPGLYQTFSTYAHIFSLSCFLPSTLQYVFCSCPFENLEAARGSGTAAKKQKSPTLILFRGRPDS